MATYVIKMSRIHLVGALLAAAAPASEGAAASVPAPSPSRSVVLDGACAGLIAEQCFDLGRAVLLVHLLSLAEADKLIMRHLPSPMVLGNAAKSYAQKVQRAQASFDTAERREDQRRLCASSGKGPTIVKLNGLSKCGLRFDL